MRVAAVRSFAFQIERRHVVPTGSQSRARSGSAAGCRILFDLAAQAVDLGVDRPSLIELALLPASAMRARLAGRRSKDTQHFTFALGQADHLLATPQFAAREVELKFAKPHRLDRRRRCGARAPENIANTQRELARLDGFAEVVRRRRIPGPRCGSPLRHVLSA